MGLKSTPLQVRNCPANLYRMCDIIYSRKRTTRLELKKIEVNVPRVVPFDHKPRPAIVGNVARQHKFWSDVTRLIKRSYFKYYNVL